MAAADITLGGSSAQCFPVDGNTHTATLNEPGGRLLNVDAVDVIVNVEALNPIVNIALQSLDAGSIVIKAGGQPEQLPKLCKKFTFKASGATTLQYLPDQAG